MNKVVMPSTVLPSRGLLTITLSKHKDGIRFRCEPTCESGVIHTKGSLHLQVGYTIERLRSWFLSAGYDLDFRLSRGIRDSLQLQADRVRSMLDMTGDLLQNNG